MALAPGSQLGGYEIRRQLGAGGMGVVYLASDLKLGRQVAIKVISGDFGADHARTRRFEQEARAASALNHPNVCIVHALGETPDGQPFIAMEYVEGHTLRHLLQAQPPTLRQALDIATQMAAGVGAAHALGIVHRDLKPENVIVRGDGLVKVLDFGLAKLASSSSSSEAPEATRTIVQTDAGVVMGTYTYMSPEQARGQDVGARADIWALGVILYELVAGRPPFTGGTRSDVLVAVLEREPVPLDRVNPRVPHELQRIVAKACADRAQLSDDHRSATGPRGARRRAERLDRHEPASPSRSCRHATSSAARLRESSAEYLITGLGRHKLATAAAMIVLAAGVFGLMRWGARQGAGAGTVAVTSAKPSMPRALTRITFGDGLQTDARFSPDGRLIAYASDRGGHFNIWVQSVAGGDPVQVTKSDASDTQPDWSPDGSTIVFRSERDGGGLYLVPALGGAERKLTSLACIQWLADGVDPLSPAPASTRVKAPCGCSRRRSTGAARRRACSLLDDRRMALGRRAAGRPHLGGRILPEVRVRVFHVRPARRACRQVEGTGGRVAHRLEYTAARAFSLERVRHRAVPRVERQLRREPVACAGGSADARLGVGRAPDHRRCQRRRHGFLARWHADGLHERV